MSTPSRSASPITPWTRLQPSTMFALPCIRESVRLHWTVDRLARQHLKRERPRHSQGRFSKGFQFGRDIQLEDILVELQGQMPVLVRAYMRLAGIHRVAAHRAEGPPLRDELSGLFTQCPSDLTGDADQQRRPTVGIVLLEVMRAENDLLPRFVERDLDAIDPELIARVLVDDGRGVAGTEARRWRQVLDKLLQREPQRLHLLLLHPQNVGFAVDHRYQPESPAAWLAQGFGAEQLGIPAGNMRHEFIGHRSLSTFPGEN